MLVLTLLFVFLEEAPHFIKLLGVQNYKCLQEVKETKLAYLVHNKPTF